MKLLLKKTLSFLPGIIGGALAFLLSPYLNFLERPWWDYGAQARLRLGQAAYSGVIPKFVLVEIDEASLQEKKRWPFDRKEYAHLLNVLDIAEAKVIVFDLIFSEPSDHEADRVFAKALSHKQNRCLAFHHEAQGGTGEPTWRDISGGKTAFRPILPCEPIRKAVFGRLGFADIVPDADGTVRSAILFRKNRDKFALSLGAVSAQELFGYPLSGRPECVLGSYCLGPIRIPVDEEGQTGLGIGFYPGEINHISFSKALSLPDAEAKEFFRDKIVFVAATAEGIRDTVALPVIGTVPGAFLHIQLLAQILAGRFFRPLFPAWVDAFMLTAIGILPGAAFIRWPVFRAVFLLFLTVLGIIFASLGFLVFMGRVFSPVGPFTSLVLAFLVALLWRTFAAEIHGRRAGELLRQFLPEAIADHLLSAKIADVATKDYHATVLFCDIRGFTTLSEQLPASEMMAIVDAYHKAMEGIFHKHGGIALDYQGDAEMVIFGAPHIHTSHAVQAVRAAVEMQVELDRLRDQWALEGKPVFEMGVGICSGTISLGIVGGAVRKQYTAIGDVANIAARLQGLSVELKSPIIIAESTFKETEQEVWATPLKEVTLKGKTQPVMVYRVNGLKEEERRLKILKAQDTLESP